jgi:hypothetical protein
MIYRFPRHMLTTCCALVVVGKAAHAHTEIKAHEITGSSAFDTAATLTERVLTVQTLLTPIPHEQAGVVRCLGINYADHAVRDDVISIHILSSSVPPL